MNKVIAMINRKLTYIYISVISKKQILRSNKRIVQTKSGLEQYPSIPFIQPFRNLQPTHRLLPGNSTHSTAVFSSTEIPTNGTEEREREREKKIVEKRSLAFVQHQRRRVAQRTASKLAKLQSCAPYKRAEMYFQPEKNKWLVRQIDKYERRERGRKRKAREDDERNSRERKGDDDCQ